MGRVWFALGVVVAVALLSSRCVFVFPVRW